MTQYLTLYPVMNSSCSSFLSLKVKVGPSGFLSKKSSFTGFLGGLRSLTGGGVLGFGSRGFVFLCLRSFFFFRPSELEEDAELDEYDVVDDSESLLWSARLPCIDSMLLLSSFEARLLNDSSIFLLSLPAGIVSACLISLNAAMERLYMHTTTLFINTFLALCILEIPVGK